MAQYQHLPIYKQTYDLLVRVTEITRGYPRDFKPFASKIREQVMEVVLLIYRANSVRAEQGIDFVGWIIRPHARYLRRRTIRRAHHTLRTGAENLPASINSYFGLMRHANAYRQRQRLGAKARLAGLNPNPALTKVTPCNT
jgi:hypothetical protein